MILIITAKDKYEIALHPDGILGVEKRQGGGFSLYLKNGQTLIVEGSSYQEFVDGWKEALVDYHGRTGI
jgi:hypothetical protein